MTTEMIHFKGDSATAYIKRLIWSEHNHEAVAGYHSPNMLYLLDEASKYPSAVIDTMRGSCTQEWNRMLLTSNCTRTSGYFYDTASSPRWNFLSIDSRSSRHTNKEEIEAIINEYGEDGDYTRIQVKGQFPRQSANNIIPAEILNNSCASVQPSTSDSDLCVIGLDIGAGKDKSCWVVRKGLAILEIATLQTPEEEQIILKTKELVTKYAASRLVFDKTGIGIFLTPKFESRLGPMVDVIGIMFGASSPNPIASLQRDWIYTRLADWMKTGGIIGHYPAIKQQLSATVYVINERGQIKLIPKKDIIKEIGHSPDEADALALSCGFMGNLVAGVAIARNSFATQISKQFLNAGKWS
jgi:hypothetical protein